jgi:hypothetical protein
VLCARWCTVLKTNTSSVISRFLLARGAERMVRSSAFEAAAASGGVGEGEEEEK